MGIKPFSFCTSMKVTSLQRVRLATCSSRLRHRNVRVRWCDPQAPDLYQPFFELYVNAVCMQPVFGAQGPPECVAALTLPPMETQMEIVDTLRLYSMMIDIDPIKGLLVRLMMADNVQGFQEAIEAIKQHYDALETLQQLNDQNIEI